MSEARKILVLGASGLIGRFVTDDLRARGFDVVGIARRFSPAQKASALDLELPVMSMDAASLAKLIGEHGIDLVVNCLGVLQDGPGSDTRAVLAISLRGCCRRSAIAAARSGWCRSRYPAPTRTTAPPSVRQNAKPSD